MRFLWAFALVVAAFVTLPAIGQDISLRASVDRSSVRENESFSFVLRASGQVRDEPDFTVLDSMFDILQRSRNTQIQILGGQTTQITEWLLQLMPRAEGRFVLPPISLAGALSSPIGIEVLPSLAGDVPGDIFLELEASPLDPYVQSQVIYTLRLFRGVSTGRSTLTPPEVSGGEALIERLGGDREYQVVRDDRSFIVLERRYAIFPQSLGSLTIEPAMFEAVVIAPSGFSSVQRFRAEPLELTVKPPIQPPAMFPDAVWLPASNLTLSERWSVGTDEFTAGIPQTRTLVLEAEGLLETQLPEIHLNQTEGIKQYADMPEFSRETGEDGLKAVRIERFAVIAQIPGELELPAVEVPWWNVREQSWDVARLEPSTLIVAPNSEQGSASTTPSPPSDAEEQPVLGAADWPWRTISGGITTIWLATLALWWQSRHPKKPRSGVGSEATLGRAAGRRIMRRLRNACDDNLAGRARELLLEWGKLQFSQSPPKSLGTLADMLPEDASRPVRDLERSLYGPEPEQWDGAELRATLSRFDAVSPSGSAPHEELLPLYR
ncbi:MAG: BatD family protein [Gammaproteobacteria bacterium]